jgi:hypothetical protein
MNPLTTEFPLTVHGLSPVQDFVQRQQVLTLHLVHIAEQQHLHRPTFFQICALVLIALLLGQLLHHHHFVHLLGPPPLHAPQISRGLLPIQPILGNPNVRLWPPVHFLPHLVQTVAGQPHAHIVQRQLRHEGMQKGVQHFQIDRTRLESAEDHVDHLWETSKLSWCVHLDGINGNNFATEIFTT